MEREFDFAAGEIAFPHEGTLRLSEVVGHLDSEWISIPSTRGGIAHHPYRLIRDVEFFLIEGYGAVVKIYGYFIDRGFFHFPFFVFRFVA